MSEQMTLVLLTYCLAWAEPASPELTNQSLPDLPGVQSVEVAATKSDQKHRIIHLLNWHYVSADVFAIDLRRIAQRPISDEPALSDFANGF